MGWMVMLLLEMMVMVMKMVMVVMVMKTVMVVMRQGRGSHWNSLGPPHLGM